MTRADLRNRHPSFTCAAPVRIAPRKGVNLFTIAAKALALAAFLGIVGHAL